MTLSLDSKCLHLEEDTKNSCNRDLKNYGAVSFPIYQTATYAHPGPGESTGFDYSRLQNPTREQVEKLVAQLEKGIDCIALSSGMAAITILFEIFEPGNHIIVDSDLYGGSIRLFDHVSKKSGLKFTRANFSKDDIEVLINDESIIHSALLYKDNSYLFEVGPSDMKVAIGYALNEGRRVKADFKDIMFNRKTSLNFRYFDEERYPLFTKVIETYKKKGTAMAFFNAVDEELISYFLKDVISFEEMVNLIIKIVDEKMINIINPSVNDIVKVDKLAREIVNSYMNERVKA